MRTFLTVMAASLAVAAAAASAQQGGSPSVLDLVLPAPQVVVSGKEDITLGRADAGITVALTDVKPDESALAAGLDLLAKALSKVESKLTRAPEPAEAMLKISRLDAPAFAKAVAGTAPKATLTAEQLAQGYLLTLASKDEKTTIFLQAQSPLGLYYGLCTLVQLISRGEEGLVAPGATIADWPAITLRLAKGSATFMPPDKLQEAMKVMPLLRLNYIGLQYHQGRRKDGKIDRAADWDKHSSRNPQPPFAENVKALCGEAREGGLVGAIVYFSPYQGQDAYRFDKEPDRQAYVRHLLAFMEQGAAGVEIDYNDWCLRGAWKDRGAEWPVDRIVSLVHGEITKKHPAAQVLWCPPSTGAICYRGAATQALAGAVKKMPPRVKVLWTGPKGPPERGAQIVEPLKTEVIKDWSAATGRKPMLWINGLDKGFTTEANYEGAKSLVFAGGRLPEDLAAQVDGMHLNDLPASPAGDVFATAADYCWNPAGWTPEGSLRRARSFASAIEPLLNRTGGFKYELEAEK